MIWENLISGNLAGILSARLRLPEGVKLESEPGQPQAARAYLAPGAFLCLSIYSPAYSQARAVEALVVTAGGRIPARRRTYAGKRGISFAAIQSAIRDVMAESGVSK